MRSSPSNGSSLPGPQGGTAVPAAPASPGEGRVLGIDFGTRRIGLAVSDPLGLTAQGLPTLTRRNKRQDLNFLRSLARRYEVSLIVLGNPINMNGSEGQQSAKAREFARELEQRLSLQVCLWDERLTSIEAERMLRESGVEPARNVEAVDRLAAVILLQNYLDSYRSSHPSSLSSGSSSGDGPAQESES
jgi:putative Holliday junction resolvase